MIRVQIAVFRLPFGQGAARPCAGAIVPVMEDSRFRKRNGTGKLMYTLVNCCVVNCERRELLMDSFAKIAQM